MTGLYFVDLPWACFGLVLVNGRVTEAPPIARWMVGKELRTVAGYVANKGGAMSEVR